MRQHLWADLWSEESARNTGPKKGCLPTLASGESRRDTFSSSQSETSEADSIPATVAGGVFFLLAH